MSILTRCATLVLVVPALIAAQDAEFRPPAGPTGGNAPTTNAIAERSELARAPIPVVPGARRPLGASVVTYKEPGTATLIAVFVPGGGHLWAGEQRKGLTLLAIGYGSLVAGTALAVSSVNAMPYLLGTVGYVGTWVYSLIDAGPAAGRMNERSGAKRVSVAPYVAPNGHGRTQLGFQLR